MKKLKINGRSILQSAICNLHFALVVLLVFTLGNALAQDHSGHSANESPAKQEQPAAKKQEAAPPTVVLSPDKIQRIGVRTAVAENHVVDRQIRTVGLVEVNETKLAFVNTKVAGWIRKLYVNYTGEPVKKGQPLLSLYSPDLVSAQQEYLIALQAGKSSGAPGEYAEIDASRKSLLESSKQRLRLWDISEEQIAELEKTGKPQTEMVIHSPLNGIVLEKMVLDGAYITPGMNLYRIGDLSTVWIIADIYEYEVSLVKIGQKARITLTYEPGKVYTAVVNYIYPVLDQTTRTVRVRLTMGNPGLVLKPQMFANVEISASSGEKLSIPEEAVLFTGERQIVYVEKQPGTYEMRVVKLGVRGEKHVEVLSGIKKGERVVTSGNFLIDSETQLRGAAGGGGHAH